MVDASSVRRLGKARRDNVEGGRKLVVKVWVTEAEKAALVVRAVQSNVTVPRLLFDSAFAEAGESATDRRNVAAELLGIRTLLGAVSNNVNQIARHANAMGEVPADAAATVEAVRRLMVRIDAAAVSVMRP
ncbi:MobC family plasmid mobilization relaxosome protein [Pseudarthrobacter sp. PS3-L1]|uniref:MobC family plasmid mobilization relaxosome protein n=1 Tax=Pseudarthrobacter sp. PS3-L1 TaxID=3046207 RepID=UPI0024BB1AE5|nr:MobC family plasmid mobilization relaxosome protein [Pseudarthrobacter sp. PS3-L1]MDJ0322097.1 MobC family plasmid mobilization relaxosome protein [Pseudarthrobacter sp. PS3-L1]